MFSLYRLEICLSSSNRFFDHGAGEIYFLNNLLGSFFFFLAFASHKPPIFFSNGDIPKLKQLL